MTRTSMVTTMVADDVYNNVDGDDVTSKDVNDDDDGDDGEDGDGDGAMLSGTTGYDNDDDANR